MFPSAATQMKLYLRRDVAEYSLKRWGGEDGVAAERRRRDSVKFDRSLARTKVGRCERMTRRPSETSRGREERPSDVTDLDVSQPAMSSFFCGGGGREMFPCSHHHFPA